MVARSKWTSWFLAAALLAIPFSTEALGQNVRDTSFCVRVVDRQCMQPIPDGSSVSISSLPKVDGKSAIYFWGNLRNPSMNVVAIYFAREGECYNEQIIMPKEKALREVGAFEGAISFLDSLTLGEIWKSLGVTGVEIGIKDIKLNLVLVEESNEFRVFDYRYAICPGKFTARLIDSRGSAIPGNNDPRQIKVFITE
ncbi:MAG: hypothetical protein KDJ86_12825 [Bauldia sp.]|uniref:hypothetical protein n=1 Tax=Bauldia sp. TaxID=2575872 RepID=UPI001D670745|nr:hypothetical protein [Bauldia sp.]MCB1496665.1 hypothetical protein [Bauldia sp.]